MIATIGVAGLVAAAAPALARDKGSAGGIEGRLAFNDGSTKVTAVSQAGGVHTTKVRRDGRYRIRRLPAGSYTLTFHPSCGDDWTLDAPVEVVDVPVVLPATPMNEGGCIIVGVVLLRED